jgi:hypothetical protein
METVRLSPFLVYRSVNSRRCISTSATLGSIILHDVGQECRALSESAKELSERGRGSHCTQHGLVDVRECFQEISVAQVVALLRAMLSIDTTENNFPSLLRVPTASISSVAGLSSVRTSTRIASPDLAIATFQQFDGCRRSRVHVGNSTSAM